MENESKNTMPPSGGGTPGMKKSSTGLEENVGGLLAYLLGFISGVVFLLIEKENSFIRFHAMQSTIVFGGLFVLSLVVNFIPIIGILISLIIAPVSLILWIILMVKAYRGERYHLMVTGKMAEEQLKKMNA
ncbi:membrane protein [Halobacillus andaensis]|uniref:Membrane protein n=1 Tax=Halobacillus andaensis TaxID=1176239 RepID=A0A917B6I6_HALAA|nr:DUF4870 domain-containing protein [Halobacillus andaensis]MBP2006088.1 putative membrane protein [Halobacillus andaensis]GGF23727.1 membrane protein [Halobacillus andaensis]